MTGLELLKEEMRKRGCNTTQCNSALVPIVLDILAESGDIYRDLSEAQKRVSELLQKEERLRRSIEHLKVEEKERERLCNEKAEREWIDAPDYVQDFYKELENCETSEGRDALRAAQMFVNSVDNNTCYDNTAFIIGLASILSGGNVGAIEELRKINKKIPSPDPWHRRRL